MVCVIYFFYCSALARADRWSTFNLNKQIQIVFLIMELGFFNFEKALVKINC